MTDQQRSERARLCEERVKRRWRQEQATRKCKRVRDCTKPPRVLLTPEARAAISRSNLKIANLSRQSTRGTPEAISTVWWSNRERRGE